MSKTKKTRNRPGLSDKVASVKSPRQESNPFELHFNRRKREILGHSMRGEKGRPGIAKAYALKKRKQSLQKEWRSAGKCNEFVDRRVGENFSSQMSHEERLSARFTVERKKQSRKAVFNLDDTTELTHMGQTLEQLAKFEDPRSDDEDDNALSAEFVRSAHFGGGLLSRSGPGQGQKEWVEQMIDESKKRKHEARRQREVTLDMTDKLDEQYQRLLHVFNGCRVPRSAKCSEAAELTPVVQSLGNSSNGPSSHGNSTDTPKLLGNSTETSKSLGNSTDTPKLLGNSADTPKLLGNSTDTLKLLGNSTNTLKSVCNSTDGADPSTGYDMLVRELTFVRRVPASDRTVSAEERAGVEAERLRQQQADRLQRMKNEDDDDHDEDAVAHISADLLHHSKKKSSGQRLELVGDKLRVSGPAGDTDLTPSRRETADTNSSSLQTGAKSGVVTVPGFGAFCKAMRAQLPVRQVQHIEQLSAGLSAAQRLHLYRHLLRYMFLPASFRGSRADASAALRTLDVLTPALYALTQTLGGAAAARCWTAALQRRHAVYQRRPRRFPPLAALLMLRTCRLLFPTSDRRHPVAMPASVFLAQLLAECRVTGRRQLAAALFVCTLLVEYTELSRRWVPEVYGCLESLLYTATAPEQRRPLRHIVKLPFSATGPGSNLLLLSANCASVVYESRLSLVELATITSAEAATDGATVDPATESPCRGGATDDQFRLTATHITVGCLLRLAKQHGELSAAAELLQPAARLAAALDLHRYPEILRARVADFIGEVDAVVKRGKTTLAPMQKRPKPLHLYEPVIEENFDGKRRREGSAARRDHDQLVRGYKRQLRSTVRELRRDNALISRHKLDQRIAADNERKNKVKSLMSALGNQEGDFRKMERQKK